MFNATLKILSAMAGAMSVFLLISHSIEFGIASALHLILKQYSMVLDFLFGWLTPIVFSLASTISKILGWTYPLTEHWKHVFVLFLLYISRDFFVTWAMSGIERKVAALAILLHGLPIALISSVIATSVGYEADNILIVKAPVIGAIMYNLIKSVWDASFNRFDNTTWMQTFTHHALWVVLANILAGIVAYLFAKVLVLTGNGELSILALFLFVGIMATRHYVIAWYVSGTKLVEATNKGGSENQRLIKQWENERDAHKSLAASVALPLIGGVFFLIINAGLLLL